MKTGPDVVLRPVALITGASSGIGAACVRRFALSGWDVLAVARRPDRLDDLVQRVRMTAGDARIESAVCDVRIEAMVKAAVARLRERFGRMDALINNAGYAVYGSVEDTSVDAFRDNMETNFFGVLNCTKAALPLLRAAAEAPVVASGPAIVMVSSIVGRRSFPGMTAYCASKFALEALSEGLRIELAEAGISVSVINPSVTKTAFFDMAEGARPPVYLKPSGGMSPDRVARMIFRAVYRPRRNGYLSCEGKAGVLLQWLSPRLFDFLIARLWRRRGEGP